MNEPVTSRQNCAQTVNYGSRPACLNRAQPRSWEAGHAPSAPRAPGSSKRDAATALAAVQENKEPHLRRQACSTLLRSKEGSERAFAWARELRNDFVSWDHRPQTSTASTTNTRAPNQFWVTPFLPLSRCVQGHSVRGGATWLPAALRPSQAMSRSRTRTFVATRRPGPRRSRSPRPKTREQAGRWWPGESSGEATPAVMRGQGKREVQAA